MTAVLEAGAGEADVGTLASRSAVCFPFEDGKGARAYLALFSIVLLDHLHVRVFWEAVLAY